MLYTIFGGDRICYSFSTSSLKRLNLAKLKRTCIKLVFAAHLFMFCMSQSVYSPMLNMAIPVPDLDMMSTEPSKALGSSMCSLFHSETKTI